MFWISNKHNLNWQSVIDIKCLFTVGSGGDPDAENGARLTCHLLLRLFQMMNASSSSSTDSRKGIVFVRSSCDRHLLEAAHHRISVGAVVAVLKALLMLGKIPKSTSVKLVKFTFTGLRP